VSSAESPPPVDPAVTGQVPDQRDTRIAELEDKLDDLAQQLLAARDAVAGAEAELAAVKAHTVEVEHQLHVRIVEVTELQQRVEDMEQAQQQSARPNPVAKRISPLLARAARINQ
jgi:chromosome segregation ATPase